MEKDSFTNKKRKNESSNQMEEDYNIYYDQKNTHLANKENFQELNQIVDVDFLFSEIRKTYFFGVKYFLEGLLDFNDFDSSGLADLILEERDFLGTVIKTELEEESGNDLPDLYALTTLVPYDFFPQINSLNQIIKFALKQIGDSNSEMKIFLEGMMNKCLNNNSITNNIDMSKFKLGVFINERVSNLPQPLVGPLLNLLREDIANFKEANDGDSKYDITHVLYITKIVKSTNNEGNVNNNKKRVIGSNQETYLYYKYDDEYFLREADQKYIYKVPLKEKELDNIENKNELIYKAIMILSVEKFYKVVEFLNKEENRK